MTCPYFEPKKDAVTQTAPMQNCRRETPPTTALPATNRKIVEVAGVGGVTLTYQVGADGEPFDSHLCTG